MKLSVLETAFLTVRSAFLWNGKKKKKKKKKSAKNAILKFKWPLVPPMPGWPMSWSHWQGGVPGGSCWTSQDQPAGAAHGWQLVRINLTKSDYGIRLVKNKHLCPYPALPVRLLRFWKFIFFPFRMVAGKHIPFSVFWAMGWNIL